MRRVGKMIGGAFVKLEGHSQRELEVLDAFIIIHIIFYSIVLQVVVGGRLGTSVPATSEKSKKAFIFHNNNNIILEQ